MHRSVSCGAALAALAATALAPLAATAQSAAPNWEASKWQYGATIYGYLPQVGGSTNFPVDAGGSSIHVDAKQIVDALKFAFMGTLNVTNGRYGAFNDVMYLDIGGSKSKSRDFSLGNAGIPADTTADLDLKIKGWVWTVAGEYRLVTEPNLTFDALAGARLLDIKENLGWSISGSLGPITTPGRSGSREVTESLWDGIVGVKGRYAFGADRAWIVPFYADVGAGQSKSTWQAAAGLGYAFKWGDVSLMWRYLDYKLKDGHAIESVSLNGPLLAATFRW